MDRFKPETSRPQRGLRLVMSAFDPRAWLHLLRMVNHYNHTHVQPLRRLTRGRDVRISPDASFAHPERITLGDRVRLGARVTLWAGPAGGRVTIGDDCLFGPDVLVTAAGYRFDAGHPVTAQPMDEASVTVGRDVWIGAKAILLPGATVGNGCIIGAGAVVRGAIPDGAIAVGVPARIVGYRKAPP